VHQHRALQSGVSSGKMRQDSLNNSKNSTSYNDSARLLESKTLQEEHKEVSGPSRGGMYRHEEERIDRLGKQIKSKRERQPNGQKKRLAHRVTFCDQL